MEVVSHLMLYFEYALPILTSLCLILNIIHKFDHCEDFKNDHQNSRNLIKDKLQDSQVFIKC